jgi:hypothetical protein
MTIKLPTRKTHRQMRARLIILTQHQFSDSIDICLRPWFCLRLVVSLQLIRLWQSFLTAC